MRGLCIIFTWTFLVTLCEPEYDMTESCLHDVIQESHKSVVPSGESRRKVKRHARETLLTNPLRIQPVYFLSQYLLEEEKLALQKVLQRAISKIESLLSVIHKVEGPLLLKRKDACPIVLKNGINKGRCSRIQKGYQGEYCLDRFKIPSDHLEGFSIYNKTNPDPIKMYATDGPGLEDTDFVLYVTSQTTALCNPYKTSALAYAAACQLDNHGRPIAGQVNFCPRTLKAQKFDEELLYKTAIHELFHALGFSNKLFEKFVSCDMDGNCNPRKQPLVQTVNGIARLVTPAVVREMRKHFDCNTEVNFGGPLEIVQEGKVSSHWDPIMMHSSIMTAKEQKPYLTFIDHITLAVFEDSGWYNVDYSQADPFIWGRGKGCQFGTAKHCNGRDGFCSSNSTGCHHLRLSKAKCNSNPKIQPTSCGIFAADQKPCFFLDTSKVSSLTEDETLSVTSRCYLSSLAPMKSPQNSDPVEMTGRCYETKCEAKNVYVRVQSGDWILCHPGSKLQIEKFDGFIECPPYFEICTSFHINDLSVALPASSPQLSSFDPTNNSHEEDKSKRRYLYADIKISTRLNDAQISGMKTAFIRDVTVKNEILVSEIKSTSSHNSVRICISLMLEEDNTLDRFTIKDFFYKSVTKTFDGHYDDDTTIDVLTSSNYFCKSYHGSLPWYLQEEINARTRSRSVMYMSSVFTTAFMWMLCTLITVIFFPLAVFW